MLRLTGKLLNAFHPNDHLRPTSNEHERTVTINTQHLRPSAASLLRISNFIMARIRVFHNLDLTICPETSQACEFGASLGRGIRVQ